MKAEPKLNHRVEKIFDTITSVGKKLSDAFQEIDAEFKSQETDLSQELISVKQATLDFDLLEDDLKRIVGVLEQDGSTVIGSYLLLDNKKDLMEIEFYRQKDDKTFKGTIKSKINRLKNCPEDMLNELEQKGQVRLRLLN